MTMHLFLLDLEIIMRQALTTALLTAAVIVLGGVIFGWEYALFLGCMILLVLQFIKMVKR